MNHLAVRRAVVKLVHSCGAAATCCRTKARLVVGQPHVCVRRLHYASSSLSKNKNNQLSADIRSAEYTDQGIVKVSLSDGTILNYPWVWLRDNCQCNTCFNPQLHSRTIYWRYFDTSVKPVSISADTNGLKIAWSDNHESNFSLNWLQDRSFTKNAQDKWLQGTYKLPRVPWDTAEFPKILKKISFQDILQRDSELLAWLRNLAVYGVAIVTDTPKLKDQLRRLANRVSFIKRTHYGEEFELRNKPDTTNLAYLSTPLQMHTDLPYYEFKPGVNMLHCLVQTEGEGGENQLTDILHVSNQLKQNNPDVYRILSTTPVVWSDIGEERGDRFHSLLRSPVICEDRWGEFSRVNYSQQQRDSHFSVPLEDVIPWYDAHAVFTKALYDPQNIVQFKTKPGEILTFDNVRMVHGRSGYDDTSTNERYLIGAYLDWDIAYSRIRVLQNDLKK